MRRREFIALGGAVVWPVAALTQEPGRLYRIGWLTPRTGLPTEFRDALREFGWIEGKTAAFEVRHAEGRRERLPGLAADLVRGNVDIILAEAPAAIRAAKQATTTIPVPTNIQIGAKAVFQAVADNGMLGAAFSSPVRVTVVL